MYSLAFLSCSLSGRLAPVDYNLGVPSPFQLGLAEENHRQRCGSWFPRGLDPGPSAQAPNLTGLLSTRIPVPAPSVLLLKRLPALAALVVSHCPWFLLTLPVTLCEVSSLAPLYLDHPRWILFLPGPWSLLSGLSSPEANIEDTQMLRCLFPNVAPPEIMKKAPSLGYNWLFNAFNYNFLYVHLNLEMKVELNHKYKHEKHFIFSKIVRRMFKVIEIRIHTINFSTMKQVWGFFKNIYTYTIIEYLISL